MDRDAVDDVGDRVRALAVDRDFGGFGVDVEGEADDDVLLYWPIWDSWHDASRRRMDFRVHDPAWFHDKPFGRVARALHESGVGVDYVSDRQLSSDISAARGRVRSRGGEYQAIVVPTTVHCVGSTMMLVRCPVCELMAPRFASSSEKSPLRIAVDGTLNGVWNCFRSRYPSKFDMKNKRFLKNGPLAV